MSMTIKVRQDDIDLGERMRCDKCPVALAITKQTPYRAEVYHPEIVLLQDDSTSIVLETPQEVKEFVEVFDQGGSPWTFEFELDIDSAVTAEEYDAD